MRLMCAEGLRSEPAPLGRTLVLVGIVLCCGLYRDNDIALLGGFALAGTTVILVPWAIYTLVRIAIHRAERRARSIRLVIWTVAIIGAFAGRSYWDTAAREQANAVAASIMMHKNQTGAYPESVGQLHMDALVLEREISLTYRIENGEAALFYSQPSMPMVAHHYDFETRSWKLRD